MSNADKLCTEALGPVFLRLPSLLQGFGVVSGFGVERYNGAGPKVQTITSPRPALTEAFKGSAPNCWVLFALAEQDPVSSEEGGSLVWQWTQ